MLGFKDIIPQYILPSLIVCYFSQQTTAGTETSQKTRITGIYMHSSVRISPANSHKNILENWQIEDPPIATSALPLSNHFQNLGIRHAHFLGQLGPLCVAHLGNRLSIPS